MNHSDRYEKVKPREPVTRPEGSSIDRERKSAEPPAVAPLSPLTGRDSEVSLLKDRWERAQDGMGQVVLLVGEPGLGKSRLVHTIKQIVTEQMHDAAVDAGRDPTAHGLECAIIEWRCSQRFQNTGLHPVSDALARFLGFENDEPATARFDRLAQHLDELGLGRREVVALFAKLLFLPPDERYPAPGLTPVREREETFRALRQWLRACSERQPLLFAIEDLHWMDASTLEFLGQFIADGLHDRILAVLTFRPEFQPPWPTTTHQTSIALNRLTRRQVAELLRQTGVPLPDSLVSQLYQRTGGVPLLAEEFARIIRETVHHTPPTEGRAKGPAVQAGDIPITLQDLVLARLDRLSTNREVAQLAATLGREFHYEVLAAVVSADEETLAAELEKLVDAEILSIKGQPPRCTYAFKHALVEEALHGALREEELRQFHRQVAEAMEKRFPETVARQPELLAQHFTEAGLVEQAVGYWVKAAHRAQEKFANIEAIAHLNKGLSILEILEPSATRDARELDLLGPLGTASIAARGYAAPEVGPVFNRARVLCERVGQTPQVFTMMWGNFAFHIVRGDFRLCADLAEEAMEFATRLNDPGILMEAHFLRGLTALYRGDFAEALTSCAHAITHYDDRERTAFWAGLIGEDAGVTTRAYLMLSLWHNGFADQALEFSRETVSLAREIKHPFSLEYALHHTGWLHQHCRLGAETRAAGEEGVRVAEEQGYPFWHASSTIYQGSGMVLQGNLEEGLRLMERGLEAYRATGAQLALPYYLSLLADAFFKSGRMEDARHAVDEALTIADKNDERFQEAELRRLRGELLLAEPGREANAEDCFLRAIETARGQKSRALELRATTSLARLWARTNRRERAFTTLTAIFGLFTEGFGTPDLVDAAALLRELSNERMRDDFAAGVKYVRDCIPAPIVGPVSVDWRYVPSSTLGGDTIGYHWIDSEHLAFYLIDVTGHGLDSALLSVTVSNVLRSGSLPEADMRQPDQVLGALNRAFQGRQHGGKFFTIWYGVYHTATKFLHWAGGGHHASLLFSSVDSAPIPLASTGPMMGVLRDAVFPSAFCPVSPGGRLVIFSDGVFEIRRDKRSVWNLTDCIQYLTSLSQLPESVMDETLRHARKLRGSQQLDDDFSIIEARFE